MIAQGVRPTASASLTGIGMVVVVGGFDLRGHEGRHHREHRHAAAHSTAPEVGKWQRLSITSHWLDVQATSVAAREGRPREDLARGLRAVWSEHNTEAFAGLHNKGKRIS